MSLTPEESARLNTAVDACARAADAVEEALALMRGCDTGSVAAAVATHNNAVDAHKNLFGLCQPRAGAQKMITTRQTVYVRVDGSDEDSRDGLSEAQAVKSLGAAVQRVKYFWSPLADDNAVAVTIDIGPGTFASAQDTQRLFGGGLPLHFQGAGVDKTFVGAIHLHQAQNFIIENLTVQTLIEVVISTGLIRNCTMSSLQIHRCNLVNLNYGLDQTLNIENNASEGINELVYLYNSNVRLYGKIILNAPTVQNAGIRGEANSVIYRAGSSSFKGISGSLIGRRFYLSTGSIINSGGLGEEWLPGTEPGTKDLSSFYL